MKNKIRVSNWYTPRLCVLVFGSGRQIYDSSRNVCDKAQAVRIVHKNIPARENMASAKAQITVRSENNQPNAKAVQMHMQRQQETRDQGPTTTEGVNKFTQLLRPVHTNLERRNDTAETVDAITTNDNVTHSPTTDNGKLLQRGKLIVPAMFLRDSLTSGAINDTKLNKCSKPEIKQRTEPTVKTVGPTSPGGQSNQTSKESPTTSPNKSPNIKGQSSHFQLDEHKVNTPTQEQKVTFIHFLEQKCSGKKFSKIALTACDCKITASPKTTLPSYIDLSHIRQQYLDIVSRLKEELVISAQNKIADEDVYVDTAPALPPRKSESTNEAQHVSIIADITAEEKEYLLYQDGYTLSPAYDQVSDTISTDDGLYEEAVTREKVDQVKVDRLHKNDDKDQSLYEDVDMK